MFDTASSAEIDQVSFKTGDILFKENELSYHFYIIQEGKVEIFKMGRGGVKIPLAVVSEGSSLGEFAMIDRLPRSATARAITDVVAAKVSDIAYQQLLTELPEWAVSVMSALVERLRQTNEIVRRSGIISAEVKKEIEQIEYDTEGGTITNTSPMLSTGDNDDNSDFT
jgi:CRP/FNR family cyclic AMP-dependent transcriptional regulator